MSSTGTVGSRGRSHPGWNILVLGAAARGLKAKFGVYQRHLGRLLLRPFYRPLRIRRPSEQRSKAEIPVILVHHWLVRRRGGERVLEALLRIYQGAPVYTLVYDERSFREDGGQIATKTRIHESLLRFLPSSHTYYPYLLPILPMVAMIMKIPPATVALYSDASLAKLIRSHKETVVVCYCHSPMRYVWENGVSATYVKTLPRFLQGIWPLLARYLRWIDRVGARRVDIWIANSNTVAKRIADAYGEESVVIHPPVDVPETAPIRPTVKDFYLVVAYHVAYKRTDLAIAACEVLGRRLVVVGDGPEIRGCHDSEFITFVGYQTDEVVLQYYKEAKALLFAGEEDFGIVPVEAMANGCPVIAYGAGGASESVIDGVTGVLFEEQSAEGLTAAMTRFESMPPSTFDSAVLWRRASEFTESRFAEAVSRVINDSARARRP